MKQKKMKADNFIKFSFSDKYIVNNLSSFKYLKNECMANKILALHLKKLLVQND